MRGRERERGEGENFDSLNPSTRHAEHNADVYSVVSHRKNLGRENYLSFFMRALCRASRFQVPLWNLHEDRGIVSTDHLDSFFFSNFESNFLGRDLKGDSISVAIS